MQSHLQELHLYPTKKSLVTEIGGKDANYIQKTKVRHQRVMGVPGYSKSSEELREHHLADKNTALTLILVPVTPDIVPTLLICLSIHEMCAMGVHNIHPVFQQAYTNLYK